MALATLPLTACLFDSGGDGPRRTNFNFSLLDTLSSPLAQWYDIPAGKSLIGMKFAFRSMDYGHDADSVIGGFAQEIGRTPAAAGAYIDLNVDLVRLRTFLDSVHATGAVPYVTFDPKKFSDPDLAGQYGFIEQIPQGYHNLKLGQIARTLRDFGRPVLFRFAHEMNGNWYPYSGVFIGAGVNTNKNEIADGPEKYINAWRYVHTLFAAEGVEKIAWVYSPNDRSFPDKAWNNPFAYYPGSKYVDLIAVDVYEHPDQKKQSLAQLLEPFYNTMGLFWESHAYDPEYALRPFGLGEFGTSRTDSAEQAAWYAEALETIANDARIRFHAVYNDRNGDKDFRVWGMGDSLKPYYANARFVSGPLILNAALKPAAKASSIARK